tara:strand:+ start:247 stop:714 length:468 start_codon:yes stop_codon:yes gene_type:complete
MDDLVLKFFKIFSRFEFALKEASYLKGPENGNASPNWDLFVKDFKAKYQISQASKEAVSYLFSEPPKKQKVVKGSHDKLSTYWEPMNFSENTPELKKLVDIITTIRNNLFHGGKYGEREWDNEDRVKKLLESSIFVLNDWLELNEDINFYFHDFA